MSYSDYLSKYQFKPGKEEGQDVSDWLATEEGHQWQDKNFYRTSARGLTMQHNTHGSDLTTALFSISRAPGSLTPRASWPNPQSQHDLDHPDYYGRHR